MKLAVWLALFSLAAPATAAEKNLTDFPFWKASAGWWQSENTYFDGALNYNIRSYNSLVHVEIDAPVLESGMLSVEHIHNVIGRLNQTSMPASVPTTLELEQAPVANTSRYDTLRQTEVDHA